MKKFILFLAFVSLCFMGVASTQAANESYTNRPVEVVVNGQFIAMDVHPTLDNDRLFIPIRSLASLGIHYSYSSNVVTLKNAKSEYLKITVGSKIAYKGNQKLNMDQAAKNLNGRVLVPIRFVSEALNFDVTYDSLRKMVFVNAKDYTYDMGQIAQEDLQAARIAAISLPITHDFKSLGLASAYHEYSFPVGRSDVYIFSDGRYRTLVKIKDGKATGVGQYDGYDLSKTAGAIAPNFIPDTDPLFEAYHNGNVLFWENTDGTATAIYNDDNEKRVELKTNVHLYPDLIQKLPH
ncbi:hypothetical protein PA598K_03010 [Paenibacillus sp. 598K]|uniref:copper amine oxidase N-terminal domain-containing protein n=1 Tax=Paenibacillus sp. 598K TaxID=1117987 RepID=UPI000FFA43D7|nr:copper amine oxidase N-terminal domain-containing protein [Paenibacillus sp. 598K]GBF74653.1 hypothetical protein PA598K_03010 [Paenibacillus sp. 598K]